ncbi:hypothetical protein SEA_MAIH_1 [Streptomyces phage Maih]|uniref:Uncharacterized protein n=3 Tax=Woodruffvirus TP1604 TaxID=1982746 RepID=A0A0U3TEJ2_9CAUD|nr:hypothetical protein SEA_MAIH_1 [Streptomyces phage Maih]AWN08361.1 hypothetical protein SEA_BAYC_1 [Streptomyces phage BayC]AWN08432.1 hypothetical protein SEA_SALETE_1 [Streptomyces phage Salete]USH45376.1 hypothetical protein SEA_ASIS_1 [Streptomyces phage Asis]
MAFVMFRYRCNMTTVTHVETVAAIAATPPSRETFAELPPISFELRLELSHAAMAVLLDVPEDTQAALSDALKEADALAVAGVLATRQNAVQRPELFQSQPILKAAGDLIRSRGWVKGEFDRGRALCAMGAIRTVTRGDQWFYRPEPAGEREAVNVLLERIAHEFGPGLSVPGWNDRQEDVQDVLRLLF